MSPTTPLIRVSNLYRRFGSHEALRDVSFALQPGDILGFLGPNGAGKSTTMRILTGNLAPSSGAVAIQGHDLFDEPRRAKSLLGFLPEHPPVYPELTVDEYLAYCARLNGVPRGEVRQAVHKAKARCGIEDSGGRLIGNISRGYQQRVGLAQAIIHGPEVVVLDEPTIGLDPIQVREIRDLIRELGEQHGVILSTHILPEVQAVCNRVQIIHEGELVFSEGLDDLNQRLRPSSLRVALTQPPAEADLADLAEVTDVEDLGEGHFRLHHAASADLAETVAHAAVANGWGLHALVPEEASLEQIFVDLTLKDSDKTGKEAA